MNNSAVVGGGGGIYYQSGSPCTLQDGVEWLGNDAVYGPDVASYPRQLALNMREVMFLNTEMMAPPPEAWLIDQFGQPVVDLENIIPVTVTVVNATRTPLFGTLEVLLSRATGVASFDDLILAGNPGQHTLRFSAGAGNLTKKVSVHIAQCEAGWFLGKLTRGFACERCPAGLFSAAKATAGNDTDEECHSCKPGRYQSERGQIRCALAKPGHYVEGSGAISSVPCPAGRHSSEIRGSVNCSICPARTASKKGSLNCTACGAGKVLKDNDHSLCYSCKKGTYSLVPGGEGIGTNFDPEEQEAECTACGPGAFCVDGLPSAMNGWWRPPPRNGSVCFECKAEEACLGKPNVNALDKNLRVDNNYTESCANGYEGRLCHRCSPGFSRKGSDMCRPCAAVGAGATLIAILGVIVVIAAFALCIWQAMNMSTDDKTNAGLTIKIAFAHFQVMAIASNFPFRWPPLTETMFRAMDALSSVSEDVIALECMFAESRMKAENDAEPQESVVFAATSLVLIGPLILLMLFTVFWIGMHLYQNARKPYQQANTDTWTKNPLPSSIVAEPSSRKRRVSLHSQKVPITWKRTRERIIVSCIVVAVIMHPTLTRRSVKLLTCDTLDGGSYLRSDLEVICWQGAHIFWAFFVGLPFLLVYALGIPIVSWYVLYKRRHKLDTDNATVKRFGFLYIG